MPKYRNKFSLTDGEAHAPQHNIQFIVLFGVPEGNPVCGDDVSHILLSLFCKNHDKTFRLLLRRSKNRRFASVSFCTASHQRSASNAFVAGGSWRGILILRSACPGGSPLPGRQEGAFAGEKTPLQRHTVFHPDRRRAAGQNQSGFFDRQADFVGCDSAAMHSSDRH